MSSGPEAPLADRLRRAPVLSDPEVAYERVSEWRSTLPDTHEASRLAEGAPAFALLAALADHSPYLWRLVTANPARLTRLLTTSPEAALDESLVILAAHCGAGVTPTEAMAALRRCKAEVALLVALADLGGAWDLEAVVSALTRFADRAVSAALDVLVNDAARTGKLVPRGPIVSQDCGVTVLALGKGGGRELNYSSDIDLVVLYDPHSSALGPGVAAAPFFVRLTRGLVRMLGERTPDGYVLRVDLRLRPDPASTPVAVSLPGAFAYYETLGQNWERAAFIKARPIAGDRHLGADFLAQLAPFVWRKYFDYAAIADIHAMKRQIHAVRGHADVVVPGHDIKLGRGGIREIEFFVQTQQLIFGGRRPRLRGPRTLEMLRELNDDGWISAEARDDLDAAYRFLRMIEHRLQMVADEQTQRLPSEPAALVRFANFAGFATYEAFAAELLRHLRAVETHYARLFEHAPGLDVPAGSLVFAGESLDLETVETLGRLGFVRPAEAVETVRGWHFGRRAAVRSARAREVLTELVPALLVAFAGSGDPDAALAAFDGALARMPAAVELFSLLKSNGALRDLFADILGLAPRLASAVVSRPHLLDAAIDPGHASAAESEGEPAWLAAVMSPMTTEDFLDRLRDLVQEDVFLTGVKLLSGVLDAGKAGRRFSQTATAAVTAALAHVERSFAGDHGRVPGASCVVVALGKFGSREMTAASDLDLLLIYDFDPARPESDGARPLDVLRYYARLTQRLIAALTVTTRRGRLYEVDMRLRPSGSKGPVATQFKSFERYQLEEAELWEHMALTRARVVAGSPDLAARVAATIQRSLTLARTDAIRRPIAELRALVAREKGEADPWDLKLASGGLLDIEFLAQFLVLRHAATAPSLLGRPVAGILAEARALRLVAAEASAALLAACRLYTDVTQIVRLTTEGRFDPKQVGAGLKRRLAGAAGAPDFPALERLIGETRAAVRALFTRMLAGGPVPRERVDQATEA